MVTSGKFTKDAIAFAEGRNVILVDGPMLFEMIKRVGAVDAGEGSALSQSGVVSAQADVVVCPLCGGAMVKRTAKRGANAGGVFWGCLKYPGCRGIREVGGQG